MIKQFHRILFVLIYITKLKHYKTCNEYNSILFMDLYTSRFKFQIHEKFMKILNNIFENKFNNLKQFQKNNIGVDNYFWNLNTNLKTHCICSILKNHTFPKNCGFVNCKNPLKNV